MITPTPQQSAAISGPVNAPNFLISIELDVPYHWATRQSMMLGDTLYEAGNVQLRRISPDQVDLRVENDGYRHTQNAMSGVYLRSRVSVRWAYAEKREPQYVEPGYWQHGYTDDPEMPGAPQDFPQFEGIIYGIPEVDEWLTIIARREPPRLYPFQKLVPPIANHLPSTGYVLQFDGQAFRIEGE